MGDKNELEKQIEERIKESREKQILELAVGILVLEGKLKGVVNDSLPAIDANTTINTDLGKFYRETIPNRLERMNRGHLDDFINPTVWRESDSEEKTKIKNLEISIRTLAKHECFSHYDGGVLQYSENGNRLIHECKIKNEDMEVFDEYLERVSIEGLISTGYSTPKRETNRYIPGKWSEQLRRIFEKKCLTFFNEYKTKLKNYDEYRKKLLEEKSKKNEARLKERYGL